MRSLLIGCGSKHTRIDNKEWDELVTLDINPAVKPDVIHDLNEFPYPFDDNSFDEIHAYDVLEHIATQGDYKHFFKEFEEYSRILNPGGLFYGVVPGHTSQWAWGDPGHTRMITIGTLSFLSQKGYKDKDDFKRTDYRQYYKADFNVAQYVETDNHLLFVLEVVK